MPKVVGAVSVKDMRPSPAFCIPLLLTVVSTLAGACQCGGLHGAANTVRDIRSSYIRNLTDQDVVFEGIVERQVRRSDASAPADHMWQDYRLVTVRATTVYRGPQQEKFEIKTGLGGGDCGFDFETGDSYVIYARRNEKGTLLTSVCSETKAAEYAGPDLRILRGDPPAAEDSLDPETYWRHLLAKYRAKVCGRVTWSDGTPADGVSIRLVRERRDSVVPPGYPTQDWNAVSKPDGSYCFEYVSRGQYFLSARRDIEKDDTRYVGQLKGWWRPLPVRVESGKALSDLSIVLHQDLWYSARKHTLVDSLMACALVVALIGFWRWVRSRWASPLP